MKKICVLTLGIIAAASMSAQTATVKEAEKAFKGVNSYSSYQNAVKTITPAFSDPTDLLDTRQGRLQAL